MIRSLRLSLKVLLVAGVVGGSEAAAQPLLVVAPGTRVELEVKDAFPQMPISRARQRLIGTLVRANSDSIWIQPAGASTISIAQQAITNARASRGVSRLRSAAIFGATLAITAGTVQYLQARDKPQRMWMAAGAGAGVGVVIGSISPFEQWRRIPR